MLESIKPYNISFIQKASPRQGDAFDFSYIYKFFTDRTSQHQCLKYIIRVEAVRDVFALKFYAARDRKLDEKYNRIIKAYNYSETLRIFVTCASIIPLILEKHPSASFAINGAQSMDLQSDKIEDRNSNQRFRLYRGIAIMLIGRNRFEHYEFAEVSSYLIVNRADCSDIDEKKDRIRMMLINRYQVEI